MPTPFTDLEKVAEVMKHRKQKPKPSLRSVAQIMGEHLKSVHRWEQIGLGIKKPRIPGIIVDKLSTDTN